MMMPATLKAQESDNPPSENESQPMPKRQRSVTYEQMTALMVKELQLNEEQQKKVAKLNKKYKTLIEGERRERPGGQRPSRELPFANSYPQNSALSTHNY